MYLKLPGGLNVTGVVDRVDEDPEGGLVIVDYKTGKQPVLKYNEATNARIVKDKFFQLKVRAGGGGKVVWVR